MGYPCRTAPEICFTDHSSTARRLAKPVSRSVRASGARACSRSLRETGESSTTRTRISCDVCVMLFLADCRVGGSAALADAWGGLVVIVARLNRHELRMDVKNSARIPIRYPAAPSSAGTPVLLAKTSHGSRVTGD